MLLAGIGIELGASGIAAVAVGGAVIGAVAGAAYAAANGDNILEGALKGGVIGAFAGWVGASMGLAGETGAYGATVPSVGGPPGLTGPSIPPGLSGGSTVAGEGATVSGLGKASITSAVLEGGSEMYGAKVESEALKDAEAAKAAADQRKIDALRATSVESKDPLAVKKLETPWNQAMQAGATRAPGAVAAPTVAATGPQAVKLGPVTSGFQGNLTKPPTVV